MFTPFRQLTESKTATAVAMAKKSSSSLYERVAVSTILRIIVTRDGLIHFNNINQLANRLAYSGLFDCHVFDDQHETVSFENISIRDLPLTEWFSVLVKNSVETFEPIHLFIYSIFVHEIGIWGKEHFPNNKNDDNVFGLGVRWICEWNAINNRPRPNRRKKKRVPHTKLLSTPTDWIVQRWMGCVFGRMPAQNNLVVVNWRERNNFT